MSRHVLSLDKHGWSIICACGAAFEADGSARSPAARAAEHLTERRGRLAMLEERLEIVVASGWPTKRFAEHWGITRSAAYRYLRRLARRGLVVPVSDNVDTSCGVRVATFWR